MSCLGETGIPTHRRDDRDKKSPAAAYAVFAVWAALVSFRFFQERPLEPQSVWRLFTNFQPPPIPSDFLKIAMSAKHFLFALVLLAVGVMLGRRLLTLIGAWRPYDRPGDRWETVQRLILALGLGWGALMYLIFLLGAVGGLYTWAMWGLIFALILVCARDVPSLLRDLKTLSVAEEPAPRSPLSMAAAAAIGVMLLLIAIIALAPSITHDTMVYHLGVPRQYILAHRIVAIPYNLFSNTFLNMEMLYTGALLIDDFILANLIHYILGVGVVAFLYSFARKNFGASVAAVATLMLFFNPTFLNELPLAWVDIGMTFYFTLAMYCLWKWNDGAGDRWLVLACVFAGIFAGMKYTSIYGLVSIGAMIAAVSLGTKRRVYTVVRNLGLYGLVVTLFVAPYLIKNYVITGNPVYPVAYGIFGGRWLLDEQVARMLVYVDSHGMGRDWLHMLALPWNITIHGAVGFDNFDAVITPLWLIFLPALALTRPNPPLVKRAALACAVYFLAWAAFTHITRYTMPMFPLLSLVCASVIVSLGEKGGSRDLRRVMKYGSIFLCGLVWFSFSYFYPMRVPGEFGPVLWGEQTRDAFLAEKVPNYGVFKYINENLPADARLVFFWDNRDYFCERPKIGDSVIEAPTMIELAHRAGSAEAFHRKLVDDGYTHVMYNALFHAKFPTHTISDADRTRYQADLKIFKRFLKRHCDLLYEQNLAGVYALRD